MEKGDPNSISTSWHSFDTADFCIKHRRLLFKLVGKASDTMQRKVKYMQATHKDYHDKAKRKAWRRT